MFKSNLNITQKENIFSINILRISFVRTYMIIFFRPTDSITMDKRSRK